MAGVYINGMEMPDYGYVCLKVFANGDVVMTKEKRGSLVITGISEHIGRATPVPDHGRLGDLDELEKAMRNRKNYVGRLSDPDYLVADAPTVLPADMRES